VHHKSDPASGLREAGATANEILFLNDLRQRVEINAFTSGALIEFIEGKLTAHGLRKVVPDVDTLTLAARYSVERAIIRKELDAIQASAVEQARAAEIPADLEQQVTTKLLAHPAMQWDQAVADVMQGNSR
jgi:hypothetical protein